MGYFLRRSETDKDDYFVVDDTGHLCSDPAPLEAAKVELERLRLAETLQHDSDPLTQQTRAEKAAYRRAKANPWLLALFLPNKRTKLRRTSERWNAAARKVMPKVKELIDGKITPNEYRKWADGGYRTEAAAEERRRKSESKRETVKRLRDEGRTNQEIARAAGISKRQVQRLK